MSERPTPEELAHHIGFPDSRQAWAIDALFRSLHRHGYVIVHPDDVPVSGQPRTPWLDGWDACRAHIFGRHDA